MQRKSLLYAMGIFIICRHNYFWMQKARKCFRYTLKKRWNGEKQGPD